MSRRRKNSPLTHRTLSSMGWASTGAAVEMVLHLLVVAVLARLLQPGDFGVVSIALVVTGFIGIFGELGLSPAVVQRDVLTDKHISAAFAGSMLLAIVMLGLLVLVAPALAAFFEMPALTNLLRVVSLSLIFKAAGVVPGAMLQREMRFRDLAMTNVLSYSLGFGVVGVAAAAAGWGAWALIAAQISQAFVQAVRLHVAHPVRPTLRFEKQPMNDLLSFGTSASAARILNYLAIKGDNLVVGHLLGASALGFYGRAYQIMAMPADIFHKVVQSVLLPALAKVQNEPLRLNSAYLRGSVVTAVAVIPATVCVIVLAPEIVRVLLGEKWLAVIPCLRILAIGMFARVAYKKSAVVAQATGAVNRFAMRQILYPIFVFSGAAIGSRWGIEGVAVGVVIAVTAHYLSLTQLGLSITGLSAAQFAKAHLPALTLGLAALVVTIPATSLMRSAGSPALLTLSVVGTTAAAVTTVLLIRWPLLFMGPEGQWLVQALQTFVRRKKSGPGSEVPTDKPESAHQKHSA